MQRDGLVFGTSGQRPNKWTVNQSRWLADQLRQNHYLKSVPTRPVLYFEYHSAIVCFAIPANRNISNWLLGKPGAVLELSRLWAPDGHRPNLLTEALAGAVTALRQQHPQCEALISYADPNAGHGGGVYRAASWVPLGRIDECRDFRAPEGGRSVGRRSFHSGSNSLRESEIISRGYVKIQGERKFRFARGLTRAARRAIAIKAATMVNDSEARTHVVSHTATVTSARPAVVIQCSRRAVHELPPSE
jgi:hypothetical protein